MYSSSSPLLLTMGVHSILLILTMEEAACLQYRGQGGVGRLLHRKEERRHMIKYTADPLISLQWRRGGT